jgi:hypothetical protein
MTRLETWREAERAKRDRILERAYFLLGQVRYQLPIRVEWKLREYLGDGLSNHYWTLIADAVQKAVDGLLETWLEGEKPMALAERSLETHMGAEHVAAAIEEFDRLAKHQAFLRARSMVYNYIDRESRFEALLRGGAPRTRPDRKYHGHLYDAFHLPPPQSTRCTPSGRAIHSSYLEDIDGWADGTVPWVADYESDPAHVLYPGTCSPLVAAAWEAFYELSLDDRDFYWRYINGVGSASMAEQLNITKDAARQRVSRLTKRLREAAFERLGADSEAIAA